MDYVFSPREISQRSKQAVGGFGHHQVAICLIQYEWDIVFFRKHSE